MSQIFHIAPASVRPIWFVLPILLLAIVIGTTAVIVGASMRGARSTIFELSDEGLRVRGDVYGRLIPSSELRGADAAHVNISNGPFRLTARTIGTALPGYRSGWFRLANGEKALVYVTDPTRVVHVPTTAGYSLLLSVAETDQFVDRLHAMSGSKPATAGVSR
jgi:hypothetical protein